MFSEYVEHAMRHARYGSLEDGSYFGDIPGFDGLWADAPTRDECVQELKNVLEDWILLHVADHTPLPQIDGLSLEVGRPA
ncbi:MAG: type II toxin-antitoxin system HicB family antitoxin [Ktedonobacterales bacterium]